MSDALYVRSRISITRRDVLRVGGATAVSVCSTGVRAGFKKLTDEEKKQEERLARNPARHSTDYDPNDPFNPRYFLGRSGNDEFDLALISELKSLTRFFGINPGFKYLNASMAFSTEDTFVEGTKGTVFLGIQYIHPLMKKDDGGIAVAGACAHECGHVYQNDNDYSDRLFGREGKTIHLLELHADFLAGYYLKLGKGASDQQLHVFTTELMTTRRSQHGSAGQRAAAIHKGVETASRSVALHEAAHLGEDYVRRL